MAIKHYSEIQGYDSNGDLVESGIVKRINGQSALYCKDRSTPLLIGSGIVRTGDNQIVVGRYNHPDKQGLFIVATGSSSSEPDSSDILPSGFRINATEDGAAEMYLDGIIICENSNDDTKRAVIAYEDGCIKFLFQNKKGGIGV